MAITFVSAGAGAQGSGSVVPGMPAGATTDDLILLVIEGEGEDGNADPSPTGGDWTLVDTTASGTSGLSDNTRCTVYRAWYDAGLNLTVPDAGDHTNARCYAFRGVDTTTPIEADNSGSSTNATSHSEATGLTTLTDDAMVAFAFTHGDNRVTSSHAMANLDSVTEVGDFVGAGGSDSLQNMLYGLLSSAGAAGTAAWSVDQSEETAWVAMSLKPLPTGPVIATGFLASASAVYEPSVTKTTKRITVDIVWGY